MAAHTCKAPVAPVNEVGRLLSYPSHVTASKLSPKPANQLSRRSLVVPVLPASGNLPARVVFKEYRSRIHGLVHLQAIALYWLIVIVKNGADTVERHLEPAIRQGLIDL